MTRNENTRQKGAATPATWSRRRSLLSVALSTVVEWYDFTLFLYLATVLARVFFGDAKGSLAWTLASFAVAYLLRPIGAVVLGQIGDRFGRRPMMLWSMGIMAGAMALTATLPSVAQVGPAAGYGLIALRCLMGFSVGGEYNSVVAYLLEGTSPARRGLLTSLACAASELGGLLAALAATIVVNALPSASVDRFGWRVPFAFGALMAAAAFWGRWNMPESPDFHRQRAKGSVPAAPMRTILQSHAKAIARGFAISALGSITYYVGITFVPTFLIMTGALDEGRALTLSTVAAFVAMAVTPIAGWLSDRVGRKPVLLTACLAAAALPGPCFAWLAQGAWWQAVLAALGLAAIGGSISASGAVTTAELLPGEGRLSGLALGASAATALFGGLTPYASQASLRLSGFCAAPGLLIAAVAVCVLPVVLWMPETKPQ